MFSILTAFLLCHIPPSARAAQYLDFMYSDDGASVVITNYIGPGGVVTIPNVINGMPVVSIGILESSTGGYSSRGVFVDCTNLMSVTIPNGVTYIGVRAFSGCSSLTNIVIPKGVVSIESGAFYGCVKLTNIVLPNSMIHIGTAVFEGCTGLRSVSFPHRITAITSRILKGCSGLTNITMGNSVSIIADEAFSGCTNLESIILPDSIHTILYGAFRGCTGLTSITIGKSLTHIWGEAFFGCDHLTSVYFLGKCPTIMWGSPLYSSKTIVYFIDGTTGWEDTFSGCPTALWEPQFTYYGWAKSIGLISKFPKVSEEEDDADQDGMTNLAEMYSGTDPTDPESLLMIESEPRWNELADQDKTPITAEQHVFYFQSVQDKQYEIQSVDRMGGNWQTEATVTATTTQKRIVITKSATQRFYRLMIK